jgi:hypothetical protein
MAKHIAIPNQVFVGYPWRRYKAIWEAALVDAHKRFPLHFVAIGRRGGLPAGQLLGTICDTIDKSTHGILDATGGNANVSLEYGYARAVLGEARVFLFLDEDPKSSESKDPIISDLAGAVANKYEFGSTGISRHLQEIASQHQYTKNFERFCRQRRYKGGQKKFALRIIRKFDGQHSVLRRQLLDDLVYDTRKKKKQVEDYLRAMHEGGLIGITRGNEFSSRVSITG